MPQEKGGFKEYTDDFKDFLKNREKWGEGCMIQEIIVSNLALMGFKL